MELTTRNYDSLYDIHNSLNGTSTLLLGLASYDGIEPDVEAALNIIADILEDDRIALRSVLNDCKPKTPQHVANEEWPTER